MPPRSTRVSGRFVPFSAFREMNDPELISATLNGDDTAFETLMKRYSPLVAAYLHGAMPSSIDIEDLIQEIFFSAYRHLGQLKHTDRIRPWLLRIARNKRNDFYRRQDSQPRVSDALHTANNMGDDPLAQIADTGADIAPKAEEAELSAIVSEAVGRLSDKYRPILNLRLLEEMTTGEIARQLNLKESTVRTRLLRGLTNLRKDLKRRGIRAHRA